MPDATEIAPGAPCPICGKPAVARFQPFCSARCTDVDLNRWLSGVYVVPGPADAAEEEDSSAAPGTRDGDKDSHNA